MPEIISTINTIIKDWPIISVSFVIGGAWFQIKMWFNKVNAGLDHTTKQHAEHSGILENLHTKLNDIETRQIHMEETITEIHQEPHTQDIKLAIIENNTPKRRTGTRK